MTLTRTTSGLINKALFHGGYDRIVYLEGVRESLPEEVAHYASSFDIVFWKRLFKVFLPDVRVRFAPLGSKTAVLDAFRKVQGQSGHKLLFAVDNDVDPFRPASEEDKLLLRTHGYSWENDVWNQESFLLCATTLARVQDLRIEDVRAIQDTYRDFNRKMYLAVRIDTILQLLGDNLFTKNCVAGGCIAFVNTSVTVDTSMIKSLVISKLRSQQHRKVVALKRKVHTLRDMYGHGLAFYFTKHMQRIVSGIRSSRPSDSNIWDVIMLSFVESLLHASNVDIKAHYERIFKLVEADFPIPQTLATVAP